MPILRIFCWFCFGLGKSCIFAVGNQSGIRYDFPEVRAVAYRFSTTYLLHSAAIPEVHAADKVKLCSFQAWASCLFQCCNSICLLFEIVLPI